MGIIVVLLIVLVWYLLYSVKQGYVKDILTGCFEANSDFLEKGNISKFNIAISPERNSYRYIYIIMLDLQGDILINEDNRMKLNTRDMNPFTKKIKYIVTLDKDIADGAIPKNMNMIYEPTNKSIVYIRLFNFCHIWP